MTGHRLLATAHVGDKPGCHPVGCQNTHQRLEGEFFMKNSPSNPLLAVWVWYVCARKYCIIYMLYSIHIVHIHIVYTLFAKYSVECGIVYTLYYLVYSIVRWNIVLQYSIAVYSV